MVLMLYIWGVGKLSYTGIDGINVVHLGDRKLSYTGIDGINVVHLGDRKLSYTGIDGINVVHLGDRKLSYTGIDGINVVHLGGGARPTDQWDPAPQMQGCSGGCAGLSDGHHQQWTAELIHTNY